MFATTILSKVVVVVVVVVGRTDLSIPRGWKWEYVYVYMFNWKSLEKPYDDIFHDFNPWGYLKSPTGQPIGAP